MAVVCPTVTAYTKEEYDKQLSIIAKFAGRIHIDLTDGKFTNEATVGVADAHWPDNVVADFHLMFKDPKAAVHELLPHKPNLIVVHREADVNFHSLANACHDAGVKFGVALLQDSPAEALLEVLSYTDHVLIFSGNLGYQGGSRADLDLLHKAKLLKQHKAGLEIGWDGGVNNQNASEIVFGGVDVLNVGGYIQNAEDPEKAYHSLARIADETGTT